MVWGIDYEIFGQKYGNGFNQNIWTNFYVRVYVVIFKK